MQFLPMKDRSAKAIGKSFKKAVTMGVNNEINFLLNGKLRLHSEENKHPKLEHISHSISTTVDWFVKYSATYIYTCTYIHFIRPPFACLFCPHHNRDTNITIE